MEASQRRSKGTLGKANGRRLNTIAGRRDQLVGKIQEGGITREQAEREIECWGGPRIDDRDDRDNDDKRADGWLICSRAAEGRSGCGIKSSQSCSQLLQIIFRKITDSAGLSLPLSQLIFPRAKVALLQNPPLEQAPTF